MGKLFLPAKTLGKLKAKKVFEINENGQLNPIFKYFNEYKKILPLSDDYEGKSAFILDKKDLNTLKSACTTRGGGGPQRTLYINLEGWNDGVNLISDDKNLESAAKRVLTSAIKILQKNKDCTLDEAIGFVLNHKFKKFGKEVGVNITTIRNEAPATRAVVLDQMRPLMPTESLIKSTIESIAKHYSDDKKAFKDLCLRVAKYYEDNINAFQNNPLLRF